MHYNKLLLDTPLLNSIRYYDNKNNNVCFLLSYISTNLLSPFCVFIYKPTLPSLETYLVSVSAQWPWLIPPFNTTRKPAKSEASWTFFTFAHSYLLVNSMSWGVTWGNWRLALANSVMYIIFSWSASGQKQSKELGTNNPIHYVHGLATNVTCTTLLSTMKEWHHVWLHSKKKGKALALYATY